MDPLSTITTRRTPQSQKADPRQVPNSAGGHTFALDDDARLRRFLILGTDGGTYYTSPADLTKDNARIVLERAEADATGLTDLLVDISTAGRAPKQNPTLFALAAAASLGDDAGRAHALAALPKIARTGTHLFLFARYVEQFRGWGRGLRRGVAAWYLDKSVDDLAYQAVKYRQREGWSHRDLLRLSHPKTEDTAREALFDWMAGRDADRAPAIVRAFVAAQAGGMDEWLAAIADGASWEMLPDAALAEPKVWNRLLDRGMPMTALIRQLPRLTRLGVAKDRHRDIAAQLTDGERLRKARVHPVNVLVAQRTYASGRSARGESEWTPVRQLVDALDRAFYASFAAVEPAGKRTLLALDVSGSMGAPISGMPLSAREASAALAMVQVATEPDVDVVGFTAGGSASRMWGYSREAVLTELDISPRRRLDDVLQSISNLPFGGTDCALPVTDALARGREYDTFVVYTDNETWSGSVHPHQALRQYREQLVPGARMVVMGMTSTGFSIADPTDPGMLDVVGFDSAVPQLITDFSRGL